MGEVLALAAPSIQDDLPAGPENNSGSIRGVPVTSLYLSEPNDPLITRKRGRDDTAFRNRIIGLLSTAHHTLTRLAVFIQDINGKRNPTPNVLRHLTALEELVTNRNFLTWGLTSSLPTLRRLAFTGHVQDVERHFTANCPALEILVARRSWRGFDSADLYGVYDTPRTALSVFLVEIADGHSPLKVRNGPHEPVKFFEVDVPVSYYGDEGSENLVEEFIREGAVRGTIWDTEGKPM